MDSYYHTLEELKKELDDFQAEDPTRGLRGARRAIREAQSLDELTSEIIHSLKERVYRLTRR